MNERVVEKNGRFRGMEERVKRMDSMIERRFPMTSRSEETRRASGQESNLHYPQPNWNQTYPQTTFQMNPCFVRQVTPYPNTQPYHPPQRSPSFVETQIRILEPL